MITASAGLNFTGEVPKFVRVNLCRRWHIVPDDGQIGKLVCEPARERVFYDDNFLDQSVAR